LTFASLLPDSFIEYATDVVFIAAFMASVVYVIKRLIGFLQRTKHEVTDDD